VRVYDAAKRGDFDAAERIQKRIDHVRDVLLIGDHNWISGLSCGLAALGIGHGRSLLPLQPVGAERKALIYDLLAAGVSA
jgi:dihydrodipicolinate synthase/N-acetylneuraminate lyase